MTGRDLISGSLRLIGVLASGEPLGAAEATDGLSALNDMLDSFSNENLLIPYKAREVFPLISGQQSYTMGTAGNFNTTRPIHVENVLAQLNSGTSTLELPVKIITKDEFQGIVLKQITNTYPMYVYAENTFPLETLNFWPIPQTGVNIVIYSSKALVNLPDLTTAISLPPGYQRLLRYNLALELAPEYGRQAPEAVLAIAAESRASIKRKNSKPHYLQVDDALIWRSFGFNWRTGEPT